MASAQKRWVWSLAMTRARKSLAMTTTGLHRFLGPDDSGFLRRKISIDARVSLSSRRHYESPTLSAVDLSFAHRLGLNHPAHLAITAAKVGSKIQLVRHGDR
jgi:ATP-dependent DNA helicase RecQ